MENQETVVRTFTLAQIIGAVLAALLTSGALSTLVTLAFTRKAARNKEIGDEAVTLGALKDQLKDQIHESVSDAVKLSTAETERDAFKVMVEARDEQIASQGRMLRDVLVEQGKAEERERMCRQQLAEMRKELDGAKETVEVNRRLVKDNLLLKGMNDDLKRELAAVGNGGDNVSYGE